MFLLNACMRACTFVMRRREGKGSNSDVFESSQGGGEGGGQKSGGMPRALGKAWDPSRIVGPF